MAFWTFRNSTENPEDGVLQIDGVLVVEDDWWSDGLVIARNVRRHLDRLKDVTVYINSPGGDVMAGSELYTALREHSEKGLGKVTVKVTGIAASAASVVAMAGDEILMSPTAYMMIHNPWTSLAGNAKELRHQADVLDVIGEGLINAYQRRTGKSRDELIRLLDGETYMSAQTCVDEGFADGILWDAPAGAPEPSGDQPRAMMQLSAYGRQAVMAMAEKHGLNMAADEAKQREEIRRRAEIIGKSVHVDAFGQRKRGE